MDADELALILDELESRVEGPGKYLFDLAVREVLLTSILYLILFAVVATSLLYILYRIYRWSRVPHERYEDREFPLVFGGLFILTVVIFGSWIAVSSIVRLLNPEYAAISDILEKLVP
jgi:tellurite resistance protein TehA-like permease